MFPQGNPRTTAIRIVAKLQDLDLAFETVEGASECSRQYLELNPLGKVPTFVRNDGFVLTECIAITIFCKADEKSGKKFSNYISPLQ